MTEQVTEPTQDDAAQQPDVADLLARLEVLTASQTALQEQIAEQAVLPEADTTPAPAPPPEPVGRITRQQYDTMSTYAAQQAQSAEKYKLAAKHGLQPEDLDGEFASPQAMQQYAELLALRKNVEALEQSLQVSLEPPPPPEVPPEGEEGEAPPGDTGGPTGTQSAEQTAVAVQYEAAKALGRTVSGRRAMLQAIYTDPEKQSPARPRE